MLKVKTPTAVSESSSSSSSAVVPKPTQKEKKSLTEQLIHSLEIDGKPIVKLRLKDGFCNFTYMAKAGGKRPQHYLENAKTHAFINALEKQLDCRNPATLSECRNPATLSECGNPATLSKNPTSSLIDIIQRGKTAGTWIHPRLAINAAQWISVDFDLAVSELVQKFMSGQLTTEESQETGQALFVGDVFKTPERLAARAKDKTARKTMRELIKIKLIRPGSSDYAIPANIVNVFAMDLPTSTKKFMNSMKLKGPAANFQSVQQLSCATWINDSLYEWLAEQLDESVTRKQLIDKANFYGNIIAPVGKQSRKLLEY